MRVKTKDTDTCQDYKILPGKIIMGVCFTEIYKKRLTTQELK